MRKEITFSQFIAELQKYEAQYGDKEFLSVGGCSGEIDGLKAPHSVHLREPGEQGLGEIEFFIPSFQEDLNIAFEVQTFKDDKGYELDTCQTYKHFEDAVNDFDKFMQEGEYVRIVKVDKDGHPIEEMVANF